jgi:hypothetical protein
VALAFIPVGAMIRRELFGCCKVKPARDAGGAKADHSLVRSLLKPSSSVSAYVRFLVYKKSCVAFSMIVNLFFMHNKHTAPAIVLERRVQRGMSFY